MVDAVAVAGHVRSLLHGDADAKARAAGALWDLMASTAPLCVEHTNWITRAGAIPLLVDLLPVAIAAAGGIAPLVELVRSGSADAKDSAARALGNLACANDDNQVAIAAAGGIAPLVEVVRSGSDRAKASAVGALANLAYYNPDNQVAIAAAGAIAPLVALTRSGGQGAEDAEAALTNLAYNNVDNQVLIAEAKGDIKTLVVLARSGSSAAAKNAAARFLARRRLVIVRKCVDGKVPAELDPAIAACLARRGFS
ncbi:hypothetical protein JL720_5363 [Aureococcus anophagefferens]|nr:hypothetical protein JL720_5363 [Aureococcus anophagefferens]